MTTDRHPASEAMMAATYWKDGKEYYIVVMHPYAARVWRAYEVEDAARLAARAAGHNWRRVKREGRKAVLAWKRENPSTPSK